MPKTTVRDRVFQMLCENRSEAQSGEAIAKSLNVSRTAVWKAVESLRNDGYPIEGTTNRGYFIDPDFDLISTADIVKGLSPDAAGFYDISLFSTIDSTNTALVAAGRQNAAEGTVFIAEEQTAGKGRMGRGFYSPKGSGIYISVLFRPSISAKDAIFITTLASVAAARASEAVISFFCADDEPVRIKWVNDLFLRGRKFCGILTEAGFDVETGGLSQAVLGAGFNLCPPQNGWPKDISATAGSLFKKKQPAGARALLASCFLNELYSLYSTLPNRDFAKEYKSRQLVIGRRVEVMKDTEVLYGAVAVDIDESCNLLVLPDGESEYVALNSGEIRIKL